MFIAAPKVNRRGERLSNWQHLELCCNSKELSEEEQVLWELEADHHRCRGEVHAACPVCQCQEVVAEAAVVAVVAAPFIADQS